MYLAKGPSSLTDIGGRQNESGMMPAYSPGTRCFGRASARSPSLLECSRSFVSCIAGVSLPCPDSGGEKRQNHERPSMPVDFALCPVQCSTVSQPRQSSSRLAIWPGPLINADRPVQFDRKRYWPLPLIPTTGHAIYVHIYILISSTVIFLVGLPSWGGGV